MSNASTSSNDGAMSPFNASGVVNSPHRCIDWPTCETREIDVAGWMFVNTKEKSSNLTVIPSLAVIIFLVLIFLKVYKWCKESARRKARGDVEFGDESDMNYGIIMEGDKEFCKVEIRSDTTSVYDTVNSFRLFGNGHATCIGATPSYHDTATSYKSLLIQRGDASHYDSVKSYKAFLRQVTQNKNLDVEVKLLENYPVKCKSNEHCVLMEEEIGECSSAKSKLHPGNIKTSADGKKRFRYRRASGDPLGPMRKRSASNPIYNSSRPGATSLPSIHYSVSSDSSNEEDKKSAFRTERRKAFEDRCKKMSRSCSGGKLSKGYNNKNSEEDQDNPNNDNAPHSAKRKRHYSADGGSRLGRPPANMLYKISRAFQHELNNLRESISETDPKPEEHVMVVEEEEAHEDSSSENPDSSPSSRNSSISSDAIESQSEDDETHLVTQISAASDCTTFNSNNETGSSTELLFNPSSSASLDGLTNIDLGCTSIRDSTLPSGQQACSQNIVSPSCNSSNNTTTTEPQKDNGFPFSNSHQNVDHFVVEDSKPSSRPVSGHEDKELENLDKEFLSRNSFQSYPAAKQDPSSSSPPNPVSKHQIKPHLFLDVEDSEDTDNSVASNPRRVKRFHVTSVQGSDLSSQKSDCRRNSSGGSAVLDM